MKLEQLPLLDIFNSLRQRHGLPLGVDEYLTVLRSLQAGFGIGTREELEQLCCLVWAKSEEESRLIRRLFEQMWRYSPDTADQPKPSSPSPESEDSSAKIPESEPLPELEPQPNLTPEPVQAVQAVRSSRRDRELRRPRYSLLTEYFPVTRRQMKQTWRYLRRPVREGIPTELDVEATVAKIGREGILLQPVLIPPRKNRTDLVLMIDQDGSMVPFHQLSRQLVETAQRGGRLRQTRVFYFHDYPDQYLYRHPAMLNAQPISEVLEEIGERAVVLIVSDAGAKQMKSRQEGKNLPCAVILTAIPVEYTAVRAHLSDLQEEMHPEGTIYERGNFSSNGHSWQVGIVEMGAGIAEAAVETKRAIDYFKPNVILFVGVAGGLKDVKLGDVVAATKVYGYESGKVVETFQPRPNVSQVSYRMEQRARAEARKEEWLQRIQGSSSDLEPKAWVGAIAAGDKVVASTRSEVYQQLRQNYGSSVLSVLNC
ncbi:phosphorylase family protein [Coleofasciculus sp. E2-BRE-01]|uniref:phosphorylase family protein n=1 Tax=Coleofasciculus sp. E2-BRE-01 TaxID=3069524 RepID=UPI0032FFC902